MPTLPDKNDLGGLPSLKGARSVISAGEAKADVSGATASADALAKGFTMLASGVEKIAKTEVDEQDAIDTMRAETAHHKSMLDLQNSFDTDTDYKTYRPRFAESATQATADAAGNIRNARLRTRWIERASQRNASYLDRVTDRGLRLEKEDKELEVDKSLRTLQQSYLSATDDATRERLLQDMEATVMLGQKSGLLDKSRGENMRQRYVDESLKGEAERRLLTGDPVGVMRDLGALPPERKTGGPVKRFAPEVESAIEGAATKHGVDPDMLRTFSRIESSGNPGARTGSYKGLFMLSDTEFRKHGGTGDIYDPAANAEAAAIKLKAESAAFRAKHGRDPTTAELYLVHQQGEGGFAAHMANPDQAAWKSMASTAEGRQKGEAWSKKAIWGNVPDDVKAKYGSVDNITSAEFMKLWEDKVARLGDGPSVSGRYAQMSYRERHGLITRSKIAMSTVTLQELQHATQSIIETGEMPKDAYGRTALDRANIFLQPNQVKQAELKIKEAQSMHGAIAPLRTMSESDALAHIAKTNDPKATGDNAAMRRRVVIAADLAWREIKRERDDDPAEAVDPYRHSTTRRAGRTVRADDVSQTYDLVKSQYPQVKLVPSPTGGMEVADPDEQTPEALAATHKARRMIAEARIEAQAKLGIPEYRRNPITRREADDLLQMPTDAASINKINRVEYKNRLDAAAARFELKYGKAFGPIMMDAALNMRKPGDTDHEAWRDRIMRNLLSGKDVSTSDVRRLNDLRTIDPGRYGYELGPDFGDDWSGGMRMPAMSGDRPAPVQSLTERPPAPVRSNAGSTPPDRYDLPPRASASPTQQDVDERNAKVRERQRAFWRSNNSENNYFDRYDK